MNFFNSILFFNQIFNPISFIISSLEEKKISFKTYNEYINEIDKNKTLIQADLKTLLNNIIFRDKNQTQNVTYNQTFTQLIENAYGNYTEIEKIKFDILGDIVNYALLSIFLIIAAMLTFALRNSSDDWRIDMRIYFLREAFGNMACLASLAFWISINIKTKFHLLDLHYTLHKICVYFNVVSNLGNFFLFVLSFNDYFEFREQNDYLLLSRIKSNALKKNN